MTAATQHFAQPRKDEIPDTYPPGRRCVENGCITILNRYNPGPYCLGHAAKHGVELVTEEQRMTRKIVELRMDGATWDETADEVGLTYHEARRLFGEAPDLAVA